MVLLCSHRSMRIKNPSNGEIIELPSSRALSEALAPTWESKCPHKQKAVRKRKILGGSSQVRWQCLDCGQAIGNPLPKATHPDAGDFDEAFLEATNLARETLRWEIAVEYLEKHRLRELDHQKFYDTYLQSEEWRKRRKLVLQRANGLCEGCLTEKAAEIHHLTYRHLGDEFLFELVALCACCHDKVHGKETDNPADRPCRACRHQGDGINCSQFMVKEADALRDKNKCGPSLVGFEPLR